ncbi:uncharacterized protein BDZ99DRAFT_572740 [Mytilinidion resinicola]|uniref:PHD-type domain-containing protein n=1 Tax=Mytilinidion resinicola TaxID=574789 RepID=A0A6A6YGI7_9PEZI|nr:uncharacterized protein BDZ99DRAFT_572740 [Mytilinidion resinicola]KAF2807850.1 hypothetical protein BDZ99DRAFT_572740 [Mytilinidion resinicola]
MPSSSIRPPATRKSSRTSSPFRNSNSSPAPGLVLKKEKAQTFLDSWVEPPPKIPTASFEEHGFARHGVLENMAPLGQPPSAKLKAKLRGGPETHKHSLLGKNGNVSVAEEAFSTPEMTPAAEPEQAESDPPEEDAILPPSIEPQDEDEDDEYIPNGVRSASRSGKTAMKNGFKATTPHRDAVLAPTTAPPSTRTPAQNQIMLKAVNAAMKKATDDGRPSVGDAVRRLYDESCHNQTYARLLDAILNERATPQEHLDFHNYIKRAKKVSKTRDRRARTQTASLQASPVSHAKTRNSSLTSARPADTITTIAAGSTTPSIHTIAAQPNLVATSGLNPLSNVPHLSPNLSPNHRHNNNNNNTFAPSPRSTTPPSQFTAVNGNSRSTEMVSTRRQTKGAAPPQDAAPPRAAAKQPAAKPPKSPKGKGKAPKSQAKATLDATDSELSDVNEDIIMSEPPEAVSVKGEDLAAPPKAPKQKLILKNIPKGKKPKSSTATPVPTSGKRSADEAGIDDAEREIQVKKSKMARAFPDFNLEFSAIRSLQDSPNLRNGVLTEFDQVSQPLAASSSSSAAPRRSGRSRNGNSQGPQAAPNATAAQLNGTNADAAFPDLASPAHDTPDFAFLDAASPGPADSAVASRPITRPTTPAAGHAAKRRKINNGPAKTKFSPVKGKAAVASSSRTIGGSSAQVAPDDSDSSANDEDVCASCGLGGLIIGCDHCEDWYHFACAEPPIPEGAEAPDDFVCHKCRRLFAAAEASRSAPTKNRWVAGLESALPAPEAGPKWFRLPDDVRNYFVGVKTNADGGYEEEPAREIGLDKQKGYFARPDPHKLIDHHKAVLCHGCSQSSAGKREILKCDFCDKWWHLDCLDPPAAISPVLVTASGMTRRAWKCPLHVDHDLKAVAEMSAPTFNGTLKRKRAASPDLDSDEIILRHRIRRPKVLIPQDVALPRGLRNGGIIEVVSNEDESEDEEDWVYDDKEPRPEDAILKRIPKQVIIADFIGSIKRRRMNEQVYKARLASKNPASAKGKAPMASTNGASTNISSRPIVEQQAALNLAQFAQRETDIGLTGENVQSLVNNLIAEASPEVIDLISNQASGAAERQLLEKLQELITRKLNGAAPA